MSEKVNHGTVLLHVAYDMTYDITGETPATAKTLKSHFTYRNNTVCVCVCVWKGE